MKSDHPLLAQIHTFPRLSERLAVMHRIIESVALGTHEIGVEGLRHLHRDLARSVADASRLEALAARAAIAADPKHQRFADALENLSEAALGVASEAGMAAWPRPRLSVIARPDAKPPGKVQPLRRALYQGEP